MTDPFGHGHVKDTESICERGQVGVEATALTDSFGHIDQQTTESINGAAKKNNSSGMTNQVGQVQESRIEPVGQACGAQKSATHRPSNDSIAQCDRSIRSVQNGVTDLVGH